MQKTIRVSPFDSGYAWWFIVDGHLVDQGWNEDLKIARAEATEASQRFAETQDA